MMRLTPSKLDFLAKSYLLDSVKPHGKGNTSITQITPDRVRVLTTDYCKVQYLAEVGLIEDFKYTNGAARYEGYTYKGGDWRYVVEYAEVYSYTAQVWQKPNQAQMREVRRLVKAIEALWPRYPTGKSANASLWWQNIYQAQLHPDLSAAVKLFFSGVQPDNHAGNWMSVDGELRLIDPFYNWELCDRTLWLSKSRH